MIKLFSATDTTYTTGIDITKQCKQATVTEILNGHFILEIEMLYNLHLWNTIEREMQIRATTHRGVHTFRIVDMTKTIDTLNITARHIAWDLSANLIEDIYCKAMKGTDAIQKIISSGEYATNWTAYTDIEVTKNCRIVREYVLDAIVNSDLDNSFRNRWGGELLLEDYKLSMLKRRGSATAKVIKYRRDLKGFEYFEDMSELATRVLPLGFDGLMLPEKYIDSPKIKDYSQPYIKKVKFESIKVKEGSSEEEEGFNTIEEAYKALREGVAVLFEQGIDTPKQNFRADMALLRASEQYTQYGLSQLEDIQLGDVVHISLAEHNIVSEKRCISLTYDCLLDRYIEIEFGDFKTYEELGANIATSEINIDDKLEELRTGLYFTTNDAALTIGTESEQLIKSINFAAVTSTHLLLNICVVGSTEALTNASMRIALNNETLDMQPKQLIQAGNFTWTVSMPLLFIKANVANICSIYITTDNSISIPKGNFIATIYGQAVGGMSSEFPHIEYEEVMEFRNDLYQHYAQASEINLKQDSKVSLFVPTQVVGSDTMILDEIQNTVTTNAHSIMNIQEFAVAEFTYKTFQAYWVTHKIPDSYYNTTTDLYKFTTSGVSPRIRDIEYLAETLHRTTEYSPQYTMSGEYYKYYVEYTQADGGVYKLLSNSKFYIQNDALYCIPGTLYCIENQTTGETTKAYANTSFFSSALPVEILDSNYEFGTELDVENDAKLSPNGNYFKYYTAYYHTSGYYVYLWSDRPFTYSGTTLTASAALNAEWSFSNKSEIKSGTYAAGASFSSKASYISDANYDISTFKFTPEVNDGMPWQVLRETLPTSEEWKLFSKLTNNIASGDYVRYGIISENNEIFVLDETGALNKVYDNIEAITFLTAIDTLQTDSAALYTYCETNRSYSVIIWVDSVDNIRHGQTYSCVAHPVVVQEKNALRVTNENIKGLSSFNVTATIDTGDIVKLSFEIGDNQWILNDTDASGNYVIYESINESLIAERGFTPTDVTSQQTNLLTALFTNRQIRVAFYIDINSLSSTTMLNNYIGTYAY